MVNSVNANMLDLWKYSFLMCDQKTAEGSFHFTAQIYRQQQQGDKHTGSSKPLLARMLAMNTKDQKINAVGMFH